MYRKCTAVLWESVIVFPPHGIQLETHRGPPSYPIFVSRKFIPTVFLRDIIINEGLRRWNVRYYLAFMEASSDDMISLAVAYENILPRFPILLEVYRGVKEALHAYGD